MILWREVCNPKHRWYEIYQGESVLGYISIVPDGEYQICIGVLNGKTIEQYRFRGKSDTTVNRYIKKVMLAMSIIACK